MTMLVTVDVDDCGDGHVVEMVAVIATSVAVTMVIGLQLPDLILKLIVGLMLMLMVLAVTDCCNGKSGRGKRGDGETHSRNEGDEDRARMAVVTAMMADTVAAGTLMMESMVMMMITTTMMITIMLLLSLVVSLPVGCGERC